MSMILIFTLFQNIVEFIKSIPEEIVAITIIISSIFFGLIIEIYVLVVFKKIAQKTKWKFDDVIINAFNRIIFIIVALIGIRLALDCLTFDENILDIANKILKILIIISITIVFSRIFVGLLKTYSSKNEGTLPASSILINITRIVVFIIGLLIVFQSLGISITPMLTALGVGGLAVALALQDTLSNLFSGLYILVSKHINLGDFIKLENGDEGYITDITWRSTSILALSNRVIVIPNSKLSSSIIKNFSLPDKEVSVPVDLRIALNSDLEKVEKILLESALYILKNTVGAVPEFEPVIRFHTYGEYDIKLTVSLRAKEYADQFLLKHEFIKHVHKVFQTENIEIPFPVRVMKHAE